MNLENCTSTGAQLASRLAQLIPRLIGGQIPRLAGLEIRQALDKAESIARRKQAFWAVIGAVDPQGTMSRWGLALAMADRLRRFKPVAYRRIREGSRPCQDAVEEALVLLCGPCGPESARRIWDEIKQLGLTIPRQK